MIGSLIIGIIAGIAAGVFFDWWIVGVIVGFGIWGIFWILWLLVCALMVDNKSCDAKAHKSRCGLASWFT